MYHIQHEQLVKSDIEVVWSFFTRPANLQRLTPDRMRMEPCGELPHSMYEGLQVSYKLRPLPGISLRWTSLISEIRPGRCFVDEQLAGPFKYWRHEHHFLKKGPNTLIRDIIHYQPPFGILGKLFEPLLVRNKLNRIFAFRNAQLIEIFGKPYS